MGMLSRYPTKLGSLNEPLMGFTIFFYGGLFGGLYGKKKKKQHKYLDLIPSKL